MPRPKPPSDRRPAPPPGRNRQPDGTGPDEDWPSDEGRPLGLRLLALVGALSFLMLGLSVLAPLLHPQPQQPQPSPLPDSEAPGARRDSAGNAA